VIVTRARPLPPTARGRASRRRIVEAATRLFAEQGFEAVTMRALGEAAGLDNSSLYKHFRSKRELAAEILDAAAESVLEHLRPLAEAEPDLEHFVAVSGQLADHLMRHPHAARLLLQITMSPPGAPLYVRVEPREAHRPSVQLFGVLAGWLARARQRGVIRPVEGVDAVVNLLALHLLRPATAGLLLASQEGDPFSPAARRARSRELAAFVRGALAPQAAARRWRQRR
jgi:AcrR family transcriptional regulator